MNFDEQLAFLEMLDSLIMRKAELIAAARPADVYRSDQINLLISSLSKAQGQYPKIIFNRRDSYFQEEYADFDTIMSAIRPILSEQQLAVMQQQRIHENGITMLHTILTHESGQWMESRARIIPLKEGAKVYASELNFQKSHALTTFLGITVTHDLDDDNACAAMAPTRIMNEKGTAINYNVQNNSRDTVTKEQLEELEYELTDYPDLAKMILDQWKLSALADMPKSKYMTAIKKIREIKSLRNGLN